MWKGTIEVGSQADVDQAITRLQHDKVDFVKITDSTLTPELFLYAAGAARKAGFKASGHIPMALTVEQAVDAGLASIEHLDYAFKAGSKDEAQIAADFGAGRIDRAEANRRLDASFDRDTAMHAYRDFAKRGVFVTPTLNGGRILDFLDQDDHANDPYLAHRPRPARDLPMARGPAARPASGPAWFGQMDRYGGVAQGKAADLVLLTANPLQDIAATEKIDSVVLRGNV